MHLATINRRCIGVLAMTLAVVVLSAGCTASPTVEPGTDSKLDFGGSNPDREVSDRANDGTDPDVASTSVGVSDPEDDPPVDPAIAAVVDRWYRAWDDCVQDPAGCDIDGSFDDLIAADSPFRELTVEMILIRRDTGLVARPVDERDVAPDVTILSVDPVPDGSGTEVVTCVRDRFADYIESGSGSTLIEGSDEPVVRRDRIRLRLDGGGDWRVWNIGSIDERPIADGDGSCEPAP